MPSSGNRRSVPYAGLPKPHNQRLFTTCNGKLVVLNADTGALVTLLPIGHGTDGAAYEAGLHRICTANAIGTMTVIQQDSADRYRVLENAPTRFGAHSLVVDPATHRIYVAYFGSTTAPQPTPHKHGPTGQDSFSGHRPDSAPFARSQRGARRHHAGCPLTARSAAAHSS